MRISNKLTSIMTMCYNNRQLRLNYFEYSPWQPQFNCGSTNLYQNVGNNIARSR